jgi:hypothetical protein
MTGKCERIFEDAGDGLINFSYKFLTKARLALVFIIEPLPPHPPLPPGGFSGGNSFGMQSGQIGRTMINRGLMRNRIDSWPLHASDCADSSRVCANARGFDLGVAPYRQECLERLLFILFIY